MQRASRGSAATSLSRSSDTGSTKGRPPLPGPDHRRGPRPGSTGEQGLSRCPRRPGHRADRPARPRPRRHPRPLPPARRPRPARARRRHQPPRPCRQRPDRQRRSHRQGKRCSRAVSWFGIGGSMFGTWGAPTDVGFRPQGYAGAASAPRGVHECRSTAVMVSGGEGGDRRRERVGRCYGLCRCPPSRADAAAAIHLAPVGARRRRGGGAAVRAGRHGDHAAGEAGAARTLAPGAAMFQGERDRARDRRRHGARRDGGEPAGNRGGDPGAPVKLAIGPEAFG